MNLPYYSQTKLKIWPLLKTFLFKLVKNSNLWCKNRKLKRNQSTVADVQPIFPSKASPPSVAPNIFIAPLPKWVVLLHLGAEVQLQIRKTLLVSWEAIQLRQLLNVKNQNRQQAEDNTQESDESSQSVDVCKPRSKNMELETVFMSLWRLPNGRR